MLSLAGKSRNNIVNFARFIALARNKAGDFFEVNMKSVSDENMKARYRKVRVNGKQMSLHRHIAELKIGRALLPNEVVHHVNGNKLDNRPENLEVMSASEHARLENIGKKLSDEHKEKVSRSLIGNKRALGYKHTQETKEVIGLKSKEARKRKFWSTRKKSGS